MVTKMDIEQRSAYTLMQKIHPISVKNYMRRSIFGTYLGEGLFDNNDDHGKRIHTAREKEEIFNRTEGFLVRSKHSDSDQGGISAGYGFLDSILLFPLAKFRNTV